MYNRKATRYRIGFPFFVLFIIAVIAVLGGVVMFLWNAILPRVLNVSELTYGQAVGILILCRLLFGGFRGRGGRFGPAGGWRGNARWRQKWMDMSDEEKAKFREEWKKRCGPPLQ